MLSASDWNVADATVTLSASTTLKSLTSENKVRAKAAADMKKTKGKIPNKWLHILQYMGYHFQI